MVERNFAEVCETAGDSLSVLEMGYGDKFEVSKQAQFSFKYCRRCCHSNAGSAERIHETFLGMAFPTVLNFSRIAGLKLKT